MVCWNPDDGAFASLGEMRDEPAGAVALVPWPDSAGVSDAYAMSWGACDRAVHRAPAEDRKALVFIQAMHLIVRDGCDPEVVHRALLGLEEYRAGLSDDMPREPGS